MEVNRIETLQARDVVLSVAAFPDGQKVLVSTIRGVCTLWDLGGHSMTTFEGHRGTVRSVAVFPDGQKIITASDDKTMKLWDLSGRCLVRSKGRRVLCHVLPCSLEGRR